MEPTVTQNPQLTDERPGGLSERGMALVFALLGMLILSMLAASLLFVTSAETASAFNYKAQMQASYAASAGVQATSDWFTNTYAPWLNSTGGIAQAETYNITGLSPMYGTGPVVLGNGANFPDSTISSSFNSTRSGSITMGNTTATYSVTTATLLTQDRHTAPDGVTKVFTERWEIRATGTVAGALGNSTVQETATIERFWVPLFKDAIRGKCDVSLGGNIQTDSYFSTSGSYSGTLPGGGLNVYTGADAQASVGSNALIQAVGSTAIINGNAYWGTSSGSCTGGEQINTDTIVKGEILNAPGVPFPPISPAFTDTTNSTTDDCGGGGGGPSTTYYLQPNTGDPNTGGLAPPAGHYRRCRPKGGDNVVICSQAYAPNSVTNFFFNILDFGAGSTLTIKRQNATGGCDATSPSCTLATPCNPLKIYDNVTMSLGGGGVVGASPGDPKLISFLYSGTNDCVYSGTSDFYGTIYAPNSTLYIKGTAALYGAVTALNVIDQGTGNVHYDLSLQNSAGIATGFRVVNQTRQVF